MAFLNDTQKREYEENGFIIIRGLLSKEEIDTIQTMKKRIDQEVAHCFNDFKKEGAYFNFERTKESKEGNYGAGEIKQGLLRKIQEVFFIEKEFRDICTQDKVLDIVESLLGETIYYHSSKLMCKGPGGRQKPWHQDYAYWKSDLGNQVTVWYAIDRATKENGCIQAVAGSHKKGLVPHFGAELQFNIEDHYEEKDITYAEMEPGDVLFFDVKTFHASAPNHSTKSRLSCIVDYQNVMNETINNELREPLRSPKALSV